MRSVKVALAIATAALALAPPAHAEMQHGNFNISIQGRYDFHTWIWAVSACQDQCVNVQAIPQPVAKAFPFKGRAVLADGRYTMAVDVPDGLRCGNVYYGPVIPTEDIYTWDAASLSGTMASSFAAGCDGAPGGTLTYPIQLTMM